MTNCLRHSGAISVLGTAHETTGSECQDASASRMLAAVSAPSRCRPVP